jgi:hypothetical protein
MPPRRSARLEAATASPDAALSPLPLSLVLHIFSLLPADVRARCACVCRGWRVTLDELSLWTRLDLSPTSGVTREVTDAVLAGASAKARGQLAALDVSGCDDVSFDALLAIVQANVGALRELRAGARMNTEQTLDTNRIERLLQAAPQLVACHADVRDWISVPDARRMLRNEPPFQPLRLGTLSVIFGADDEASVFDLAADLAVHASLTNLDTCRAPVATLAALNALVDAALACGLVSLRLMLSQLSRASAPALARLLSSTALKELFISGARDDQLLDGPSAALLGDALRANATLTSLSLVAVGFWHDLDAAAALLSAFTGHVSVRTLSIAVNDMDEAHEAAAGVFLGALVAANTPALTELDVSSNELGEAQLRPLLEALPANAHLRELSVAGSSMSAVFARDVLLPAVRANSGLRKLSAGNNWNIGDAVAREAEALVAARA